MDTLHFDAAAHRYTYGSRDLISVTQVLTVCGFVDSMFFTEDAAARGTAIHAAVQAFHVGGFDVSALPVEYAPYFDAYLAFAAESGFYVHACEERVCDPLLGYAGTLDLRGRFQQFATGVDVIDIKTGSVPAWVGYQTAGYARLVDGPLRRRWALHLKANGTYSLLPLKKRTDEQVFLAALTVAHAKRGWL